MINSSLLLAGLLTLLVSIAHSWLGERVLIGPLLAREPREFPLATDFKRNVLRYAWHLTSLAWFGMGLALGALGFVSLGQQSHATILILGGIFLLHGIITLILSRGRHLAWPVFMAIAVLSFLPLF